MWSTKKAYLGEDTPFRGTHKFGTSIKPIVKNEGVSHPSPFTHKIYIFCCLLLYQMKENPLDHICASFQANQIINKWTMPPFVNFKKVEIFEPLLLKLKKLRYASTWNQRRNNTHNLHAMLHRQSNIKLWERNKK